MTKEELAEFRDARGLRGRDPEVDVVLDGGWHGRVLIECFEWEG